MGWTFSWYSSFESDFNYDFRVTIDASRGSHVYNYENVDNLGASWKDWNGETLRRNQTHTSEKRN